MKTIPQRELRNRISRVLRTFVPREEILSLLARAPLDRGFTKDIEAAISGLSVIRV